MCDNFRVKIIISTGIIKGAPKS